MMLKVFRANTALYWSWEIRIEGRVIRCGKADSYQKARDAAEKAFTQTDQEHSQEIRCGGCGLIGYDPCQQCKEGGQW